MTTESPQRQVSDVPGIPLSTALEALLISADRPIDSAALAAATQTPEPDVVRALNDLQHDYAGGDGTPARGFELRHLGGGWQLYVRAGCEPVVQALLAEQAPARLSQAALETLAVIAYKQPISRGQIAAIRAVNVDSVVRTLLTRGLITEAGVDEHTQATLFETTDELLVHLGINSLAELPPISDLLDEDPNDEHA